MHRPSGKKVFLALSGGVDSSVAAALLLEEGYEVVPVFLKCFEGATESEQPMMGDCPWREDQEAAYAVAEKLGIARAFRSWNFTGEFMESVVQYLIDEARAGRTGNPDVVCNRTVKFGAFLERALAEGADFIATGHYARIVEIAPQPMGNGGRRVWRLLRARCPAKNDQTYFLWQLTQEQLARTLFPIGVFTSKEAVREEARRRGLPSADRRSTRGICFVSPKDGYAGFLRRFLPEQRGEVVTTSGRVVGAHAGTAFYTLGQRRGIGVKVDGGPYYVLEKDEKENRLIVAPPAEAQKLWRREVVVRKTNWISGALPPLPLRAMAFIRHPQESPVPCLLEAETPPENLGGRGSAFTTDAVGPSATFRVTFAEPQWAPTPGQSVVFSDGDVVLGGGIVAAS